VPTEPILYEERRRWTPRTLLGALIVTPLVVAMIAVVVVTHAWLLIPFAAFLGIALAGLSYGAATHAPALRVDERGISLTKSSAPGRTREPVLVPWPETHAVVLAKSPRNRRLDALYVLTQSDETLGGATPGGLMPRIPDGRFVPLTNWSVDLDRLSEAVHAHAPTVAVLDQR
jgi:hypothetical protein